MDVDKARAHNATAGVDLETTSLRFRDFADYAAAHAKITRERRSSRAVNYPCIAERDVVHRPLAQLSGSAVQGAGGALLRISFEGRPGPFFGGISHQLGNL
jgi:hypothetical protein